LIALLNPKTSIFVQQQPLHSGNLTQKRLGTQKKVFLHCGDVYVLCTQEAVLC